LVRLAFAVFFLSFFTFVIPLFLSPAFCNPYIVCFHFNMIEIRLVHDGTLAQVIPQGATLLSTNDDTNPFSPIVVSFQSPEGATMLAILELHRE